MRVVHDPKGEPRDLATDVDVADGFVQQSKGLMFADEIPEDYALVFPFSREDSWLESKIPGLGGPSRRLIHMLFVKQSLDVIWTLDDEVVQVKQLDPWRGVGFAKADTIIELPPGAADEVEVGDLVWVVKDDEAGDGEGGASESEDSE